MTSAKVCNWANTVSACGLLPMEKKRICFSRSASLAIAAPWFSREASLISACADCRASTSRCAWEARLSDNSCKVCLPAAAMDSLTRRHSCLMASPLSDFISVRSVSSISGDTGVSAPSRNSSCASSSASILLPHSRACSTPFVDSSSLRNAANGFRTRSTEYAFMSSPSFRACSSMASRVVVSCAGTSIFPRS